MVQISLALTFVFAGLSLSHPTQGKRHGGSVVARQAGSANVGTGLGQQFITGQCITAADCASGCCSATADGTGECRARLVVEQSGGSCDFGGAGAPAETQDGNDVGAGNNGNGAANNAADGATADAPGSGNVGNGNGQQFITGQCLSSADCASGCCSATADGTGECRARLVVEQSGGSCDFGGAGAPAAEAQVGNDVGAGNGGNGAANNAAAGACGAIADAPGAANVGKGNGQQFITGQCFSPSDCQSGCCAGQGDGSGKCGAEFPTINERGQTCDFTCVA